MDPNANLEEQRRLAEAMLQGDSYTTPDDFREGALRLAELAQALDEWLSNGGFLPTAWAPDTLKLKRYSK